MTCGAVANAAHPDRAHGYVIAMPSRLSVNRIGVALPPVRTTGRPVRVLYRIAVAGNTCFGVHITRCWVHISVNWGSGAMGGLGTIVTFGWRLLDRFGDIARDNKGTLLGGRWDPTFGGSMIALFAQGSSTVRNRLKIPMHARRSSVSGLAGPYFTLRDDPELRRCRVRASYRHEIWNPTRKRGTYNQWRFRQSCQSHAA